ncbi:MAG: response regulator [Chitinophagaceae bacterium]|nr:response regulator [Chitinophagaceae bacterium]
MKKILIVEDEADMCLLLNIILNGKDFSLDHVKTLAAAGDYLQSTPPDLVLLDNKLPDGLGIDFIPDIKKNYPKVKVIMLSGFDASAGDVALENGADTFLSKPFSKEQLKQVVQGVLSNGQ